jgi:hypothetical protein
MAIQRRAIHRKHFTANISPQKKIKNREIHRKQFSANNSPQKIKSTSIHRSTIHRRGNAPQRKLITRQFTAKTIHRNQFTAKKIRGRSIYRKAIHRRAIHRKQFTAKEN